MVGEIEVTSAPSVHVRTSDVHGLRRSLTLSVEEAAVLARLLTCEVERCLAEQERAAEDRARIERLDNPGAEHSA